MYVTVSYPIKTAEGWCHHHNILSVVLLIIVNVPQSTAYLDNINVPCKYLDSLNITDGDKNIHDGSITFNGIVYPKTLHGTYDYEFVNETYRQPVAPHVRGCGCVVKPCVRMCCPRGQFLTKKGKYCAASDRVYNLYVSVFNGRNFLEGNVFELFNYVVGKPCHHVNPMNPIAHKKYDSWILFQNGSVSRGDPPIEILNKNSYCFDPLVQDDDSFHITLMTCFKHPENTEDSWLPYSMFVSVPFLLLTIIVYVTLPELRNVHGKSLVCYLLGLVVGYPALGWIKYNGSAHVDPLLCRSLGYTVYFAFMSAFFWLNVISYDLWWNFCGIRVRNKFNDSRKFAYYSIYAWGSTMVMVAVCYLMDTSSNVATEFQPGIGIERCFLGTSLWSEFFYLYLPIMLIMACNLTFFILTFLKIRTVQKEMARITKEEDSKVHRANLDQEKAKCSLFLRLFIIMGVTWSMEPISWIISPHSFYFYVTDFMNAIQGVVIFFLFVMKVKVKELIVKRWNIWQGLSSNTNMQSQRSHTAKTNIDNNHHHIEMTSNSTD